MTEKVPLVLKTEELQREIELQQEWEIATKIASEMMDVSKKVSFFDVASVLAKIYHVDHEIVAGAILKYRETSS